MSERPPLTEQLSAREFTRWYWTLAELQAFARLVGVSASGRKADVADRIAASLAGEAPPRPRGGSRPKPAPMAEPLTGASIIPAGQSSTDRLRRYFLEAIGPGFKFDGHMRSFLKDSGGATLDDAVRHWHKTRGQELPAQSKSLEFNRFTKEWHLVHPDRSAAESRAAWQRYRSLPVDKRPPVGEA